MKSSTAGGATLREELSALTTKQTVGIIISLTVALVLEALGLAAACLGFLVIAIILYMVPHLLGVTSVKVKAVIGAVFIVLSLLVGTFAGMETINAEMYDINTNTDNVKDVTYDPSTGVLSMTLVPVEGKDFSPVLRYGIAEVGFGVVRTSNHKELNIDYTENPNGTFNGTVNPELSEGKFYELAIIVDTDHKYGKTFTIDTGASTGEILKCCLVGAAWITAFVASMYFVILIFSALMRRSIGKTRDRMEKEGRLYPQGYGRCKKCGAIVLPGEVNCRKCGEYIDVPEEFRPKKKDKFVCSECGCEVTGNATSCPKCGKRFDEDVENEVHHADGSVDTSTAVFVCTECGEKVPENAKRCPKCGAVFDEDE
ncbi:MAG: zinc-ribbon domain-containing protein [Candidatus Methanomethylophilaceae archaeon]|nr:zinc-ribbon domain-containing protein [Candidatus Methanomethylophilaceae archaeon]